jgi:hypothetical protein
MIVWSKKEERPVNTQDSPGEGQLERNWQFIGRSKRH